MIIASAVKFYSVGDIKKQFPRIISGKYHEDIQNEIYWNFIHGSIDCDHKTKEEGFLTETDQFLDRFDAATHSIKCGQLDGEYFYGLVVPKLFDIDIFGDKDY